MREGSIAQAFKGTTDKDLRRVQSRLMSKSAAVMRQLAKEAYQSGSDPWGKSWARNTGATLKRKAALGMGSRPMIATGALFNSLKVRSTGDRISIVIGEGLPYAETVISGNPKNRMFNTKRGNPAPIPARRVLPVYRDGRVTVPNAWWQSMVEPWYEYFGVGRR